MDLLDAYEWPGNIRELENTIKRLVILQDEQMAIAEIEQSMRRAATSVTPDPAIAADTGRIPAGVPATHDGSPNRQPDDLGEGATASELESIPDPTDGSLAAVARSAAMKAERALIERTLGEVHWNRRKASKILKVSYKTLLNKIKECEITRA
jgi:two-component system, NtrC family, response regulator AtoC